MRGLLLARRVYGGNTRWWSTAAAAPKISPVDAAIADTFASFAKVMRAFSTLFFFFSQLLQDGRLSQLLRRGMLHSNVGYACLKISLSFHFFFFFFFCFFCAFCIVVLIEV
jgi:hypothetical protein